MSDIQDQLSAQDQTNQLRQALITDIDNTLYRADSQLAIDATWQLRKRLTNDNRPIIAVTGNSYAVVRHRLDSGELPPLEVIVGSVGTEVWIRKATNYVFDAVYDSHLQQTGYQHRQVADGASKIMQILNAKIPTASVTFQDTNDNTIYKTSLYFYADTLATVAIITQAFTSHFTKFKIVICEEIHYNASLQSNDQPKKYCLDIVPATKADAVNYLINTYRLKQGIVAGDSGNDIDMLLETPDSFIAVAVGGHKDELARALTAATTDGTDGIFTLRGNKRVFVDTDIHRKAAETLIFVDDYLQHR